MSDVNLDPRALCDLDDVKRLVPGYQFDDELVDALIELINGLSDDIHAQADREVVSLDATADPSARLFDLTQTHVRRRKVRIGDCASVTLVRVVDADGTLQEALTSGNYVLLPRVRGAADPIRQIWFPTTGVSSPVTSVQCGRALEVTGNWGFPEIPARLRRAVAKLVIVRYVSDVTDGGPDTEFSNALGDINIAGLYRSATETIQRLSNPGFA